MRQLLFLIVCNKPHANPTIIYENIKEIHVLAVGGTLEFPILSHVLLRRDNCQLQLLIANFCSTLGAPFLIAQLVECWTFDHKIAVFCP